MPSRAVKERLAQDVALWASDGLVDAGALPVLRARYDAPGFGFASLVKSAGLAGGVLAALGLLGLIASLSGSELVGAVMALGVAALGFWGGLKLSLDPVSRAPNSARVVLALSVVFLGGALSVVMHAAGARSGPSLLLTGLIGLPLTFFLAYRFQNTFLLVLGLLGLMHWVGSWEQMAGRSTYELEVQDPRVMSVVAAVCVGVGIWHDRALRERTLRFYQAYQAVGLVYLNLSLLILTLDSREQRPVWIGVYAAVAIGLIVLGARLKSPLVTAFGVVAIALNVFTRYFESAWAAMETGAFIFVGGGLLLAFGFLCERALRLLNQEGR